VIENGHIAEINLGSNRLSGAIPASFSNLKQLRKLGLYSSSNYYNRNNLSTTNLENLSGIENLEELDLSYCQLSGAIPNSWGQLTKLKSLVLSNNTLEGELFSTIGNLTALETINLSQNSITSIPPAIGNLTLLKTLDLSNNNTTSLPTTIGNLTDLETINLSYNSFTSIPSTIENLSNLKTLQLSYNNITTLPKELEDLSSLTQVYASGNQITDVVPLLSTSIYLNLSSQTLTMKEFTYTGDDVLLANLPPITRYDRSKNDFSATNSFYLRINGSNVATNLSMEPDGSILIPKEYLTSLTPEKEVSLFQSSGTASGTLISFTT
ncbi:leucine-rich repeat domain-containing protein, partial [Formosa sp. S-31]|uniref:leucine-rich repeat domain-containing protein n=1 Tax=Formosa sp. S-31 TaxID=2790949 RepID=UPI003EB9DC76